MSTRRLALLAPFVLSFAPLGEFTSVANAETIPLAAPFFVVPEETRANAADARAQSGAAFKPRYKGGGYTVIEDFDCPSANCLFNLNSTIQIVTYSPVGQSCGGAITFVPRAGVSTNWSDNIDHANMMDAAGNGKGAQCLTTNLMGYKNVGCDSVLEFQILFRDYTSSGFSGSAIRVHFTPSEYPNTQNPLRVYLQAAYAEGGLDQHVIEVSDAADWQTVSMDLNAANTVDQVLIAVGGPSTTDVNVYFDDLEVFDYIGPSTSCTYVPKLVDFGSTLSPGMTSLRTFDVINTGTEGTLFINPSFDSCDEFAVTTGGGVTYIDPGQGHKITVSFNPTSHGVFECELDLGNPSCPPYLVTGGTQANCIVSEETIDFDDQIVGAPTSQLSFYLKNEGGSAYNFPGSDPLTCSGFEYVIEPPPSTIAPGDSIQFVVGFAPPDTGLYNCEAFIVTDCDPITLTGRGLTDLPCVFDPDTLRYGEVELGDTASMDFTIRNQSYATTIGGSLADCQGLFLFLDDRTYSLSPGESKVMTVSYVPTTVKEDTCSILTGDPTCPSMTFIGSGNENAVCVVNPTTEYDFGVISQSGSPGILDITIRNDGGRTLAGTVPANCGPFHAVGGPISYSLGFQQSTVIRFEFRPETNGPVACEYPLGIECDSLSLTGTGRICEVFDLDIDYGDVLVGDTLTQSFTVRNYSEGPMSFSLAPTCGAFTIDESDRSFELQPGFGKEVSVWFAPDTLGFFACTIATGPECDSVQVSGNGIGTPECVVEPASIDFGTIPEGGLTEQTFTIRNVGTATLTADVPASCEVFTVTNPGEIELEPNQEATFVAVFGNIENPGPYSCQLNLGGSEGCGTLSLSGIAEGPPACTVTPSEITFGSVSIDDTAEASLTITNSGGGLLAGTIASGCGPFVIVESDRSYSLLAGASRTFTVRFAPVVAGSEICALILASTCGTIDVSGFGSAVCAVDFESPASGSSVTEGDVALITWTSRFCEGAVQLELFANNDACGTIGTAQVADGSFSWDVLACDEATGNYRVMATTDENVVFLSDPFTIVPGAGLNLSSDAIAFTFDPLNPEQALSSDLTITNEGSGPLAWSAEPNHPAINMLFTAGTIDPGNSFDLSVVIDPDEVEGTELDGEITLYTNDPAFPMTTIAISLATREFLSGDVDVDDDVDVIDLAALVEHVLSRALLFSTIVELGIPDVNGDGFVDVSDVVRHARILLAGSFDREVAVGDTRGDAPPLTAVRADEGVEILTSGTAPGAAWFVLRDTNGGAPPAKLAGRITAGEGYDLISEQRDGAIHVLAVPNGRTPGELVLRWEGAPDDADLTGAYVVRRQGRWLQGDFDPSGLAGAIPGTRFSLAPAEPNPFQNGTTLRWSLPSSGALSLAIYDLAGRRVRNLLSGSRSAGAGSIVWDGRNEAGTRVPAGTYFVRGESNGRSVTHKIILFR